MLNYEQWVLDLESGVVEDSIFRWTTTIEPGVEDEIKVTKKIILIGKKGNFEKQYGDKTVDLSPYLENSGVFINADRAIEFDGNSYLKICDPGMSEYGAEFIKVVGKLSGISQLPVTPVTSENGVIFYYADYNFNIKVEDIIVAGDQEDRTIISRYSRLSDKFPEFIKQCFNIYPEQFVIFLKEKPEGSQNFFEQLITTRRAIPEETDFNTLLQNVILLNEDSSEWAERLLGQITFHPVDLIGSSSLPEEITPDFSDLIGTSPISSIQDEMSDQPPEVIEEIEPILMSEDVLENQVFLTQPLSNNEPTVVVPDEEFVDINQLTCNDIQLLDSMANHEFNFRFSKVNDNLWLELDLAYIPYQSKRVGNSLLKNNLEANQDIDRTTGLDFIEFFVNGSSKPDTLGNIPGDIPGQLYFSVEASDVFVGYDPKDDDKLPEERKFFKGSIKKVVFDPNATCVGCT